MPSGQETDRVYSTAPGACTSVNKYNTAWKLYGYERISQVLVQVKEQETRVPYRGKLPYRQ